MRTILAKSYRLTRFHAGLVIIITAGLVWLLLRHFAMISANVEQMVFYNNIQLIHRFLKIEHYLSLNTQRTCSLLNTPTWLQKTMPGVEALAPTSPRTSVISDKVWSFDARQNTLIFNVSSTRYFRAALANKISIYFYCQNNRIKMAVSPHQWCVDKRFWGCAKWPE